MADLLDLTDQFEPKIVREIRNAANPVVKIACRKTGIEMLFVRVPNATPSSSIERTAKGWPITTFGKHRF